MTLAAPNHPPRRTPLCFWLLGAMLVLFVALCTGQRDSLWDTDSWEHHRAIVALVRDLWHPGNPIFTLDVPSVRYSPYSVMLALICRSTGADPYFVLGAAGVVNMALMIVALWTLLKAFGEQRIAAAALIVMISLYGKTPGYPNTFALADLPWHALNPSTFAFDLVVFGAALLRWMTSPRTSRWWGWGILFLLITEATLDHGMTGAFGFLLLLVIAGTRERGLRWKWALGVVVLGTVVGAACTRWPWYDFLAALRTRRDVDYWFNAGIEKRMLLEWTAPAVLLAALGFAFWKRELVRVMLLGGAACWGLALVSCVIKSPALARLPLPGMLFLDLPIALFVFETGVLRPSTWPARLRELPGPSPTGPILQVIAAAMLLYCLVPQLIDIPTEPQLARVWVSRLLHKEDKQLHLKTHFDALLLPRADGTWRGIGPDDVVFSDPWSSWPIPSSRGKVVTAQHYELFVDGQEQRRRDAEAFFGHASDVQRIDLLKKYDARWILLNPGGPEKISDWAMAEISEPAAEVRRETIRGMDGKPCDMVLMDAHVWESLRDARAAGK